MPQLLTHITTGTYIQFAAVAPASVTLETPQSRALLAQNPTLDALTPTERMLLLQHNLLAARGQATHLAKTSPAQRVPLMRTWIQTAQSHFKGLPVPNAPGEGSAFLTAWSSIL